jgi:chromosome segregation ATPase
MQLREKICLLEKEGNQKQKLEVELKAMMTEANNKVQALEEQLGEVLREKQQMFAEIDRVEKRSRKVEEKAQKVQEQKRIMQEDIDVITSDVAHLKEAFEDVKRQLHEEMSTSERKLIEACQSKEKLELENAALKSLEKQLEQTLASLEKLILEQRLDQASQAQQQALKEACQVKQEFEAANTALERLGHVQQDILHATSSDVVAANQVDPFEVFRGHTNERETHISVHGLCKLSLVQEMEERSSQVCKAHEKELADMNAENEVLNAENEVLNAENEVLKAQLCVRHEGIETLKAVLSALEKQLKETHEEGKDQVEHLKSRVAVLDRELEGAVLVSENELICWKIYVKIIQ